MQPPPNNQGNQGSQPQPYVPNSFQHAFGAITTKPDLSSIDSSLAVDYAMKTNGNMALAAELLCKHLGLVTNAISPTEMAKICSRDLATYKNAIQTNLISSIYGMIDGALSVCAVQLPHLQGMDAVNAALKLAGLLAALTDSKQTTNININEYAWKQIDPGMRDLLAQLKALEAVDQDQEPNPKLIEAPQPNALRVIEHTAQ